MKHQFVVDAWSKEYENVCGEPASDNQKRLFDAVAELVSTAYKEGRREGESRPVNLYTDDRKIAESTNRGNRLLGRTAPTA